MITQRTLVSLGCILAAFASAPRLALGSTPSNWIERDGLRFAGRIDAGTVATGHEVAASLVLENTGDRPLWIQSLSPTCGCTVVDWTAAFLSPGQRRQPAVRLDAYDIAGHHRHTVFILGVNEQLLGTVIVTADAVRDAEIEGDFLIAAEFVDVGVHRAGEVARASVPVRNLTDRELQVGWTWMRGTTTLAAASTLATIAPGATAELSLQVVPDLDLWGTTLEFSHGAASVVLPVRGHWEDQVSPAVVQRGSLGIGDVALRDANVIVDLGQLALGEPAERLVRVTNRGSAAVRLQRAFTSAEHELAVSFEPALIQPGASTEISIQHLGMRSPGSFRAIVHLLFEGAPALRLNCRGFVRPATSGLSSPHLDSIVLEFDRRDPTALLVREVSGGAIAQLRALDPAAYAQLRASSADAAGRVCTNCDGPGAAGLASELRVRSGALQLALYSVLGDEEIEPEHMALLPAMADPNGTVIRILHPEHSRTRDAGAIPVVLFHDAFPLVEEAARRTRVSAVYVVAGSRSAATRVLPIRDVLVLDPGSVDAATGPIRLRLHVRAHQILDWELLVEQGS